MLLHLLVEIVDYNMQHKKIEIFYNYLVKDKIIITKYTIIYKHYVVSNSQ